MLLSVVIAVAVGVFGLFGFAAETPDGATVEARVVTGAACDSAGGTETVKLTVAGRERQARFDGCGHQPGEPVEVRVPGNPPRSDRDLLVQAAQAATGAGDQSRPVGLILLVLSGIAGAGYALLVVPGLGRILRAQMP